MTPDPLDIRSPFDHHVVEAIFVVDAVEIEPDLVHADDEIVKRHRGQPKAFQKTELNIGCFDIPSGEDAFEADAGRAKQVRGEPTIRRGEVLQGAVYEDPKHGLQIIGDVVGLISRLQET